MKTDRQTEYDRIIRSFDLLNVPEDIQVLIREAVGTSLSE